MTEFTSDVEECLQILHLGGTILYPTDTIWGLGCDATNPVAVRRLMEIKGKPENKGLIVLLADERQVIHFVAAPDPEISDRIASIIKPVTVIYEHGLNVADDVLNADGSIAIRIVKEEFCRHLLKRFKRPIVSTSANLHGQPSPQNFADVSPEIKRAVNYVVQFRQTDKMYSEPSAIVKSENGNLVTIRP